MNARKDMLDFFLKYSLLFSAKYFFPWRDAMLIDEENA